MIRVGKWGWGKKEFIAHTYLALNHSGISFKSDNPFHEGIGFITHSARLLANLCQCTATRKKKKRSEKVSSKKKISKVLYKIEFMALV